MIIGAGPTGLSLATQLTRYGIDFMIVEKKGSLSETSKALSVHARTMEIYDEIGLADAAVEAGQVCGLLHMLVDGKTIGQVNLEKMGEGKSPYPYMLILEQSKNEKILHDYLTQAGESVHWNTEMIDFAETESGVSVQLQQSDGTEKTIDCQYLVSCEGASSMARKKLGIPFEGGTYESYNFVADVEIETWNLEDYTSLYVCLSKSTFAAFFPMAGEHRYRIAGIVGEELEKAEEDITFDDLKESVIRKSGLEATVSDAHWFSVYRAHHRRAATFREGRILLAGDSGHVHSPAGGQGMNTGIQDAYNLAWKLAYVIKGYARETLLETYNEERVKNAEDLLNNTDKMFAVEAGGGMAAWARTTILPLVGKYLFDWSFFREKLFNILSQTGISYEDQSLGESDVRGLSVKAGDRMPYFMMQDEQGQEKSIYDHLKYPRFRLLVFSDTADTKPLLEKSQQSREPMEIIRVSPARHRKVIRQKFGTRRDFALLVRPDNYISLITDDITVDRILVYLQEKMMLILPEESTLQPQDSQANIVG